MTSINSTIKKVEQSLEAFYAARRREALRMQEDGKKLREIGAHFGISHERARQIIQQARREQQAARAVETAA
jgi:DNA-directed RNA polymerase sigma subunit (sigma70/sigma32)